MPYTLLTGGVRAGKSRLAASLAQRCGLPVHVIVTAEARDEEMAARIAEHRRERPVDWTVIEEPLEVADAIASVPGEAFVILDCLTLWASNLLGAGRDDATILRLSAGAAAAAAARSGMGAVVTNEVGWGIVPADALSRRYRDLLGAMTAQWAEAAERSYLVIGGKTLELGAMP